MSNEGNDDLLGNIQNGLYSDGSIKVYMQLHLQITKTPTNKTQWTLNHNYNSASSKEDRPQTGFNKRKGKTLYIYIYIYIYTDTSAMRIKDRQQLLVDTQKGWMSCCWGVSLRPGAEGSTWDPGAEGSAWDQELRGQPEGSTWDPGTEGWTWDPGAEGSKLWDVQGSNPDPASPHFVKAKMGLNKWGIKPSKQGLNTEDMSFISHLN